MTRRHLEPPNPEKRPCNETLCSAVATERRTADWQHVPEEVKEQVIENDGKMRVMLRRLLVKARIKKPTRYKWLQCTVCKGKRLYE